MLGKKLGLCYLDGTEWSIGKFKLHCLLLAVDYKGIAIPIYFKLYQHKGVLSEIDRINFLKSAYEFCELINSTIVADREFIENKWFANFYNLSLNFIIRLRKGLHKHDLIGNRSYESFEKRAIKKGKSSAIVLIDGLQFRLWIVKNVSKSEDEPLIYILTNVNVLDKRNITDIYRLRWKNESLFKHLKTNGYNLEDLRMKDLLKIRLLIAIITLAYIMAILKALEERKKKPVKKRIYQNGGVFDSVSIFKQGQSILKQSFINLRHFLEIIQYISIHPAIPFPKVILNVQ